jgi:hypothetical protein
MIAALCLSLSTPGTQPYRQEQRFAPYSTAVGDAVVRVLHRGY